MLNAQLGFISPAETRPNACDDIAIRAEPAGSPEWCMLGAWRQLEEVKARAQPGPRWLLAHPPVSRPWMGGQRMAVFDCFSKQTQ